MLDCIKKKIPDEEQITLSSWGEEDVIWQVWILRRVFLIARLGASRNLAAVGLHFREEQVHGSRLLQKKRRQVRMFYWATVMHAFRGNRHSQVYQIPPGFRHGHEQDQQNNSFLPCSPDPSVCCFQCWRFLIVTHSRCCWRHHGFIEDVGL